MARVIREEVQDKDGNIHYFHTEDCVVFGEDGRNLREAMGNVQFEDYTAEGTEIPDAETALAGITKGKKWTALFSNIKAFCKGVVLLSKVVDSENITEEGYLMSGKKCSEKFQEVSAKMASAGTFLSDYETAGEDIKNLLVNGYEATEDCKIIFSIDGNGSPNPLYSVIVNGVSQKLVRTSDTSVNWADYVMLRRGDIAKISTTRATFRSAVLYTKS